VQAFALNATGKLLRADGRVLLSQIPRKVGARELATLRTYVPQLEITPQSIELVDSPGPGNALLLSLHWEAGTTVFSGLGERGLAAEVVAVGLVRRRQNFNAQALWSMNNWPINCSSRWRCTRADGFAQCPLRRTFKAKSSSFSSLPTHV
jgi:hypothetical protein